jgi:hypothetical protein
MLVAILSKSQQHSTRLDDPMLLRTANLACALLDTLLCILVDSSQLLRAFESVNGVEAIVKLLKRSGTARSVRFELKTFLKTFLIQTF